MYLVEAPGGESPVDPVVADGEAGQLLSSYDAVLPVRERRDPPIPCAGLTFAADIAANLKLGRHAWTLARGDACVPRKTRRFAVFTAKSELG
jgi:hypothetical protein